MTFLAEQRKLSPQQEQLIEAVKEASRRAVPAEIAGQDARSPDRWIKRNPDMVRLTGAHPFNAEPKVEDFKRFGFIIPADFHVVRNHGKVPQVEWDKHKLVVEGLVNKSVTLTMADIVKMPAQAIPVTFNCAGLRRREENLHRQSKGFSWGIAGCGTSFHTGVLLAHILQEVCGGVKPNAKYVHFEGVDTYLPNGVFGTHVPLFRCMEEVYDVMLCYEQNFELLSPDHGYPLRLLIPGIIGGRFAKWLSRIVVTDAPSTSWYHIFDNQVLPPYVEDVKIPAEPYFRDGRFNIYEMQIQSAIWTPNHNDRIPLMPDEQMFNVNGYAYSGGCRRIAKVEVTLDGGKTWEDCRIDRPEESTFFQPITNDAYYRQRHYCWVFWSIDILKRRLMGCKEIAVRAWDDGLNVQPEKLIWNLLGMMNNSWFRVKVHMENMDDPSKPVEIRFEHPAPMDMKGGFYERPEERVPLPSEWLADMEQKG